MKNLRKFFLINIFFSLIISSASAQTNNDQTIVDKLTYIREQAIPFPGSEDEKVVLNSLPLEMFLSPSDFNSIPIRFTLVKDHAWYPVELNEAANECYVYPDKIKLPLLHGKTVKLTSPQKIKLTPVVENIPPQGIGDEIKLDIMFYPSINTTNSEIFDAKLYAIRLGLPGVKKTIYFWENDSKQLEYEYTISDIKMHPSGKFLSVINGDLRQRVDFLDLKQDLPQIYKSIIFPPTGSILPKQINFSNDGQYFIIIDRSGKVHIRDAYNLENHKIYPIKVKEFVYNTKNITFLGFDREIIETETWPFYILKKSIFPEKFENINPLKVLAVDNKLILLTRENNYELSILNEKGNRYLIENSMDLQDDVVDINAFKRQVFISKKNSGLNIINLNENVINISSAIKANLCKGYLTVLSEKNLLGCSSDGIAIIYKILPNNELEILKTIEDRRITPFSFIKFLPSGKKVIFTGKNKIFELETED